MIAIEVCLDISEFLSQEDLDMLERTLISKDGSVQESIECICKAAVAEYFEMILGKQIPTRADEVRQRRLFHLIKHYFQGRIPDDTEVASLFQLTENSSRSLIKATLTKFRRDLESEIHATICDLLRDAKREGDTYRVVVRSGTIQDEMRRAVSIDAPELPQIYKVRNSAEVYGIPDDTYDVLCRHYGVYPTGRQVAAIG